MWTDSHMDDIQLWGSEEMEGLSKKEKGLMDMDNHWCGDCWEKGV